MNLTRAQLLSTFRSVGEDVHVHSSVAVFGGDCIDIRSHVRIDAFALLSAGTCGILIDHHVHVGAGTYLYGGGGRVELEPFTSLSARVAIYTASDDFTGGALAGPMVPDALRDVKRGGVYVRRYALVGAGAVILPGVTVEEGAVVGALSLAKIDVAPYDVVAGCPARKVGERARRMRQLEREWTA